MKKLGQSQQKLKIYAKNVINSQIEDIDLQRSEQRLSDFKRNRNNLKVSGVHLLTPLKQSHDFGKRVETD